MVLKGPVTADDDPLPAYQRDFGDLDLLVRTEEMDAAVAALLSAGFERVFAPVAPDYDRRFTKSATLRRRFSGRFGGKAPPTFELDLHRTLAPGPFGERIPLRELHDRAVPVRINGRWYRALHPEHRFLHACLHVVVGSPQPRLHSVRDLAAAAPTTPASIGRVAHLAQDWGIGVVVRRAVDITQDRFPGAIAPELITAVATLQVGKLEKLYLASYHRAGRLNSLAALATVPALASWRDRRDFLTARWQHRRARSIDKSPKAN